MLDAALLMTTILYTDKGGLILIKDELGEWAPKKRIRHKIHEFAYLLAGIRYAASTIRLLVKMHGNVTVL